MPLFSKVLSKFWFGAKVASAAFLFHNYVASIAVGTGPSMFPTMDSKFNLLIVDKLVKRPYQTGDIVICVNPLKPSTTICKRIRATGGDVLLVSRKWAEEETNAEETIEFVQVPNGSVWLEGDNPQQSTDSRAYGPVPLNLLCGRALYQILPLYSIGWTYHDQQYYDKHPANHTVIFRPFSSTKI